MPDLEWQQRILFYRELSLALWGKTEAYSQSQRRSATYKKEDLWRLKTEGEEVEPVLCAAFTAGSAPDSGEAMAAETLRQHITRWFYGCSYDVQGHDRHVRSPRPIPDPLRCAGPGPGPIRQGSGPRQR